MLFCQRRLHSFHLSMEEKMCHETKLFTKTTPPKYLYQHTPSRGTNCHRCNMCSSYSSSPSSSTVGSSSSSSSSLSTTATSVISSENDSHKSKRSVDRKSSGCFIQQHLQSMFALLRREETLKMAVRLESSHPSRTRYLVVVSRIGKNQSEECCLLGIDCNQSSTVGLVLKVLADTAITLDGDGGFSVSVCGCQHIFKPVSVQAMWSALQTLYKISNKARDFNYFEGGNTHEWVNYYEQHIQSDRSCLNEWHTMNDIESRRPPSPDSLRSKPRERLETERTIRSKLKEIMMSVDLDEVTSKYIRSRLEEQLDMDLREFKSFIDQEMLVILGQMDEATEVFSHVYLGSEWNASNLEELNKNGICFILNVTREIDNFFPGTFDYLNIRVYDDDNTDLLKHWDNTYKYIDKVKNKNSKVLVHCKMGISRSASVVIAYAMKAYGWDFKKAFEYVQKKRSCIKPNQNFINQLETYQGMLDAMKNKEKLQRSKSETNLKSSTNKKRFLSYKKKLEEHNKHNDAQAKRNEKSGYNSESEYPMLRVCSGVELAQLSMRPKSWSPDNLNASEMFSNTGTMSQSLEHLSICKLNNDSHSSSESSLSTSPPRIPPAPPLPPADSRYNLNVSMRCENGLTYSVSQNKIVQLYSGQSRLNPMESGDSALIEKREADREHTFSLQLPSQFQGSATTNSNNLVIKGISDIAVSHAHKAITPSIIIGQSMNSKKDNVSLLSQKLIKKERNLFRNPNEFVAKIQYVELGVCYPNSAQNQLLKKHMESKKRTPFEVIDSCQRSEISSTTTYNGDPHIKIIASQATNKVSMYSSASKTTGTVVTAAASSVRYSSVKHHTTMLERLHTSHSQPINLTNEKEDESKSGKVFTLTKEFEAKLNVLEKGKQRKKKTYANEENDNTCSLPSSPVSEPALMKKSLSSAPTSTTFAEDLSVRDLVVKYEFAKCGKERLKSDKRHPPIPPRKSSLDINLPKSRNTSRNITQIARYRRSSVAPIVKTFHNPATEFRETVTKDNSFSKLNFCQQRNTNSPPVFNTM